MKKASTLAVAVLLCSCLTMAQTPTITGVVSAASFGPEVGAGSYVAIFGSGFAANSDAAPAPYSTILDGIEVQNCSGVGYSPDPKIPPIGIGCTKISVQYVSPGQINAVLPGGLAGFYFIVLNGGIGSAPYERNTQSVWPSVFVGGWDCPIDPTITGYGQGCGLDAVPSSLPHRLPRGVVTDLTGNLIWSGNPMRIGQYYVAWVTGMGAIKGTVNPTTISSSSLVPAYGYPNPEFGAFRIVYAGPVAAFPGLYQINFQVPATIGTGPQGYGAWPCGNYSWEMDTEFFDGTGPFTQPSNDVVLPLVIKNGDVTCTP